MSTPDFSRQYFHELHNQQKQHDYIYRIQTTVLNPTANEDWVAELTVTRGTFSETFKTQNPQKKKMYAKNEVAYYALQALGLDVANV
ncbi:hypothetical protein FRC01_007604 [Tulasnella sp. 417]|nr:hypothetical protein FRC01_007604 [Tulasnella sp. 417]